ncbi:MAG: hypothetical protein AABY15_05910 [Nanoarchaeota archaeon]
MKKDNKFQITKAELNRIIKEEYAAMAKDAARAEEIKSRLSSINKELKTLPETLSEVEATGTKKVKATGWTGAGKGDAKYGEKFEKIGTHLKEDGEIEGALEVGGEEEEMAPEMGYFEMKFAELGKELDAKISGESGEEKIVAAIGAGEENVGDSVDMGLEVGGEEEEEEVEEVVAQESVAQEVVAEKVAEEGINEVVAEEKVEEVISEDLEEPIEGESPAQDSDARFNDYMEKDKHVSEGVKRGTTLLSEGKTPAQKSALDKELERMKQLAKINK